MPTLFHWNWKKTQAVLPLQFAHNQAAILPIVCLQRMRITLPAAKSIPSQHSEMRLAASFPTMHQQLKQGTSQAALPTPSPHKTVRGAAALSPMRLLQTRPLTTQAVSVTQLQKRKTSPQQQVL